MGLIFSSKQVSLEEEIIISIKNKHLLRIISDYYFYKRPYVNELLEITRLLKFDLSPKFALLDNNRYYYNKYFVDSCESFYHTHNKHCIIVHKNNLWEIVVN